MTILLEVIEKLGVAITTAVNDDRTESGSEEHRRHQQRIEAMLDAREALTSLSVHPIAHRPHQPDGELA